MRILLAAAALTLALAGCEQIPGADSAPEAETAGGPAEPAESQEQITQGPSVTAQDELAATLPLPGEKPSAQAAANVPHVYMSLQPDAGAGPLSVVFAIDRGGIGHRSAQR